MMNSKWEIIEQENIGGWNVRVWLIRKDTPRVEVAHINKDGMIEMSELKEGSSETSPTLNLNRDAWLALKEAMTDKKVEEVQETTSELRATRYHLEDMRKLLKLK
jgi:hypothetical protein